MTLIFKNHHIIGYANDKNEAVEMITKGKDINIRPYKNVVEWFNKGWHSYREVYTFKEVKYGIE